jgi:hypothetical protein
MDGETVCQAIKTVLKDHEERVFGSLTKTNWQKLARALGRLWRSRSWV